jgi:hypothetical protein
MKQNMFWYIIVMFIVFFILYLAHIKEKETFINENKATYISKWIEDHADNKADLYALWKKVDPNKTPELTTNQFIPSSGRTLKGLRDPKSFNDSYPDTFPAPIDTSIVYPYFNIIESPDRGNRSTQLFIDTMKKRIPLRPLPTNETFYTIPKIDHILFLENQTSWRKNILLKDPNADFMYTFHPSKIPFLLPILKDFLDKVQQTSNYYEDRFDPTLNERWNPVRYAVRSLEVSKSWNMILRFYMEVMRPFSYYAILFYVELYTDNALNITYATIECMGVEPTSSMFSLDDNSSTNSIYGLSKDLSYSHMNTYFSNEAAKLPRYEFVRILRNRANQQKEQETYACFNTDPSLNNASLILSNSKALCESNYDFYGREKPIGIYDRPCQTDDECPFYNANTNYKNKYGGCNKSTGYCQMPVGVQPLGYRFYQPKSRALCYNCNSSTWNSFSVLDTCCEEQENVRKYPFLKSPDYAFDQDLTNRYNAVSTKTK